LQVQRAVTQAVGGKCHIFPVTPLFPTYTLHTLYIHTTTWGYSGEAAFLGCGAFSKLAHTFASIWQSAPYTDAGSSLNRTYNQMLFGGGIKIHGPVLARWLRFLQNTVQLRGIIR